MFQILINTCLIGLKLSCELCGKAAHVQCSDCRVTYYWYVSKFRTIPIPIANPLIPTDSGRTHQSLDFDGIHEKICHLLVPLRTPVAVLGSEEERIQRDKETRVRQRKLLEISKTEAHKKLFEAKVFSGFFYDIATFMNMIMLLTLQCGAHWLCGRG